MSALISVVIPTFNSSKYIERALKTIELQGYQDDLEVILVDDCSTDIHDLEVVVKRFENVRLIQKKEKSNAAASRNIGLENSRGRYVFFLDSDDYFKEGHIRSRVFQHGREGTAVIFGNFTLLNNACAGELRTYQGEPLLDYILSSKGDFRSSTISIWKEHFRGTLFDERQYKHQDWGYAVRCERRGERIGYSKEPTVVIDEKVSVSRMSACMNIPASLYFIENYIEDPRLVAIFCQRLIPQAVMAKDDGAIRFLRRNLFLAILKGQRRSMFTNPYLLLSLLPSYMARPMLSFYRRGKH